MSCDFLNRKIWGYVDLDKKDLIDEIKSNFKNNEINYYCGITAVRQSIYQHSLYDTDRELFIFDDKNIVKLSEKSEIIKNLINKPNKTDDKLFYRKQNHE